MPRVLIGNLTVHYQQAGRGPDIVLIHGLCSNLALWYLTIVPRLAESFRVTVYDLRGHGLSQVAPSGYRALDLADDLKYLIDHLQIDSAHVVGHSFGGAIALAFARRHPERLRTLTLADVWLPTLQPTPFGLDRERWLKVRTQLTQAGHDVDHDLPRVAHGFLEEFMERDQTADAQGGSLEAFSAMGQRQSPVVRRWIQLVRTTSAAAEFSDGAGISIEDISSIRHPASIAFGARSRYLRTMRGLRRTLSNHRCAIIPNAGHFFPIFHPNVIVQMIRQSVLGTMPFSDPRYANALLTRPDHEPESKSAQERR